MFSYLPAALLATVLLCSACSGNESAADQAPSAASAATETPMSGMPAATTPADPHAPVDPICEMVADSSWTDFSVYEGDTVRFCGSGCKKAFDARPAKYAAKLRRP